MAQWVSEFLERTAKNGKSRSATQRVETAVFAYQE